MTPPDANASENVKQLCALACLWTAAMAKGFMTTRTGGGEKPRVEISFQNLDDCDEAYSLIVLLALSAQGRKLPKWSAKYKVALAKVRAS